jgi:hypothetical protein
MERVVYILGAGFSAPLGIPVVRDFLVRAKDLYFANQDKYAHFGPVFDAINDLARVKNYLDSDLYDIEEVFSIIEMRRQLGSSAPDFATFISDVVKASTPEMPEPASIQGREQIWGGHPKWRLYGSFALSLARIHLTSFDHPFKWAELATPYRYDVITLNYDRALEIPLARVQSHLSNGDLYHRPVKEKVRPPFARLAVLKLHGDAYDGTIIPPTWDKSVRDAAKREWREAYETLSQANHVRVLGYSFPPTDTYFRYFLKAALANTSHLKSLDILTRDHDEEVRQRCESAFTFKFMKFREFEAERYLQSNLEATDLEETHAEFAE